MPSAKKKPAKTKTDAQLKRRSNNAFRRVIDALDDNRVRHVVIGAQAVRAYVPSRATGDLDLLVAENEVDRVLGLAGDHFERGRARSSGVRFLRDIRSGAEVHVRAAIDKSDQEALQSTIWVRLFAREVRIPAPEYLVVMKLASMRGQRKHWQDIMALLEADCVDVRFVIAHLMREHAGLIELFLELVKQATPPQPRQPSIPPPGK